MGQGRVELPTSRLSGVRSNHLSYWPGVGWDPRKWETPPIHVRAVIADAVGCCRRFGPSKLSPNTFATGLNVAANHTSELLRRVFLTIGHRPKTSLLRKEVIQPQVPLRLPCYDFTPVTDHSLGPCLLAVGSGTSGAIDSHGVTGGVYKARERIHRCHADQRLLAIPTSRSRVADSYLY